MKKVLLVFLLLVLIAAVGYIKTVREYDRSQTLYEDGKLEAARDLDAYQSENESLKVTAAEQQLAFADSLVQKDIRYQSRVDSLEGVVDQMAKELKTASAQKVPASTVVKKTTASKTTPSKHEQILSYYKRRYTNLPKDLSDYEKRIAINEIREETSQKFSISLTELKNIRGKYKLNY